MLIQHKILNACQQENSSVMKKNNGLESLMAKSMALRRYSAALTSEDQTQNVPVLENLQSTMIFLIIVKIIALHLQVEEKTLSLQQVL